VNLLYLLPFAVGICGVLQGALNRRMAADWGLGWVVMWNTLIVLVLTSVVIALGLYPGKIQLGQLKWWHFLPGLFGFVIVLCIPLSISRIGALSSFLIIISSQILVSGAWDKFVQGVDLSWTRILGASLALAGAWLATK
jgi:uncharacterized membrane protein YdcZ (DUF606 family)